MPATLSRKRLALIAGAAVLACGLVWWMRPNRPPRTHGPLSQDAYIWQRTWTPGVAQAAGELSDCFEELCVLGAEVSFTGGRPQVARTAIDWERLQPDLPATRPEPGGASARPPSSSRGRIGLALRIGPFSGPFHSDDEVARLLGGLAEQLVAEARSAGVEPAELQIDFDAAESKLAGYREWVQAIRRRVGPVPVVITALPSWLGRSAFGDLIAAADGYVLQVHSLERPSGPDAPMELCDPDRARAWVEQAARFGRPFRVALPTYCYLVAFDADGQFLGLSAEGPTPDWPTDAQLRLLRADPARMAELVRGWTADRPSMLQGLIWYRLPVADDRMNWRWPTLAAVMAGRTPQPRLSVEVRRCEEPLFDIDLVNDGDDDALLDVAVDAEWAGAELIAVDAIGGFSSDSSLDSRVCFSPQFPVSGRMLPPGRRVSVGWIRLDRATEVRTHVRATAR